MTGLAVQTLLHTEAGLVRDVLCSGECRRKSIEECPSATHLVFPYRGVFVRHQGSQDAVGEANQLLLFNAGESYCISHPVSGGDACLSLTMDERWLCELASKEHVHAGARFTFRRQHLRIDARTQALVAVLRYGLSRGTTETLEAESLILNLVRWALGERAPHAARATVGRQKLVNRAKLLLSSDSARRWTLSEVANSVGVSPVYLTQVFQQVEGVPLYRYQLRLRLSRALDLLDQYDDLIRLSMDLGFSSHSHFSSAFRQTYGRTPTQFRRAIRPRTPSR